MKIVILTGKRHDKRLPHNAAGILKLLNDDDEYEEEEDVEYED